MKLKHRKRIKKCSVIVDLNATNFSLKEIHAFKALSEPYLEFHKVYGISNKEINIKIKVTKFIDKQFIFEGSIENIHEVNQEAAMFISDIEDAFADIIGEVVGEYMKLGNISDKESKNISSAKEYDKPEPSEIEVEDKSNNTSTYINNGINIINDTIDIDTMRDGELYAVALPDETEDESD